MARPPRLAVSSFPHHIIQRGNNRQAILFTENDYLYFLECLLKAKAKCRCRVYAYVLMTNHVHMLAEPQEPEELGKLMQSVGRRYVRYINETYHRSGTLWEGRYKSAVVGRDEYLIMCSRYIEFNPVRAGMVRHPGEYRWSSYGFHALGRLDPLLEPNPWYVGLGETLEERQAVYRRWMEADVQQTEWDQIRENTQRGRLIGRTEFQKMMEEKTGRRLVGEFRGRPRKNVLATPEKVL
jgi:putative transposase